MSKFPVIQIPVPSNRDFEIHPEGAIAKYWQDLPSLGRSLVKADLRGAWVEKVTATLAERIGLPVAGCELVERADGLKMLASPNFLETGAIERAGESLLEDRFGINYPQSSIQSYRRLRQKMSSDQIIGMHQNQSLQPAT